MLSSSNAPSRKERNVASDDEDPFITFAIETPLFFLPLLFLSSTASKISASTDKSSSFLRRAFNANEDKDDDFEEDDDDDFCRTMENFFRCDFDFSKREEEEEKEDEEHAAIIARGVVEAMM